MTQFKQSRSCSRTPSIFPNNFTHFDQENRFFFLLILNFNCFIQVFDGVSDSNTPVTSMFPHPVSAESIRINPTEWSGWIALRFEVLGCDGKYTILRISADYQQFENTRFEMLVTFLNLHVPALCSLCILILLTVCSDPLCIEDRRIPDSSFFASSEASFRHAATNARLNRPAGYAGSDTYAAWTPATQDTNQYIGVYLGGVKNVSGIILQGRQDYNNWVTKFKVAYKVDADAEWMVVKDANQEEDKVCFFLFS